VVVKEFDRPHSFFEDAFGPGSILDKFSTGFEEGIPKSSSNVDQVIYDQRMIHRREFTGPLPGSPNGAKEVPQRIGYDHRFLDVVRDKQFVGIF